MISTDLQRLKKVEDYVEIVQLKSLYLHAMDETTNGKGANRDFTITNRLLSKMTDDCCGEYTGYFKLYGKSQLEIYYKETVPAKVPYASHMATNPLIDVMGNRATGLWTFSLCVTLRSNGDDCAHWGQGWYEDVYVKEDEEWKISYYKIYFNFLTPFDEGWVRSPMSPP